MSQAAYPPPSAVSKFIDGVHTGEPGVSLVLGAGNHSFLSLCDVLYELVHNNRVAILKVRQWRPVATAVDFFRVENDSLVDCCYPNLP